MITHTCAGNVQGCFIFSDVGQAMRLWGWVQVGLGGNGKKGRMEWWSANHSKQMAWHSLKTGQNCLLPYPFQLKLSHQKNSMPHNTENWKTMVKYTSKQSQGTHRPFAVWNLQQFLYILCIGNYIHFTHTIRKHVSHPETEMCMCHKDNTVYTGICDSKTLA
jgi:hypothetical protein